MKTGLSLLILLPAILPAQDSLKAYLLDPVIITATRTASNRSIIAPSVSVVPREVLTANPERSIVSLISQHVPGVFVRERGVLGFGASTSSAGQISIRGVGGSPNTQVLMMIDGRPQFMGMMGHPLADSYLSANAERIEVIRGPASVLYGSNAMGGVVNIITHSTQAPGIAGNATLSYGSHNTQHLGTKLGYQVDEWNLLGSFAREHTDGHRPYSEFNASSGYLKASGRLNDEFSIILDGSLTGFTTYDPGTLIAPKTSNNFVDITRGYAGLSIDNDHSSSRGGGRLVHNFGHHKVFDGTDWVSDDYSTIASLFQTFSLFTDNTVTAGFDYSLVGGTGKNKTKDYGTSSVSEYAVYANIQQTLWSVVTLSTGLRINRNSQFGSELVPQFGVSYRLTEQTTLRTSLSKGYRSPTIRELYLFPAPTPTLKPERLWNYELGMIQTVGTRFFGELTLYQAEGSNMILTTGRFPALQLSNSGSFVHRGVELAGTYLPPMDNLQLHANYSFINAGNETASVPTHKFFFSAQYLFGLFILHASAQHVVDLYGSNGGKDPLPDYTLMNMRLSVRVTSFASLSLSMNNLLDKTYYTMLGYPMPGRTVTAGLQASF